MCNHDFEGHPGFVLCKKCGMRLTHEEYIELLEKPKEKKPTRKKVNE